MADIFDLYRNLFGQGDQPQQGPPQEYNVGSDTIPLSLDRTPVNDPYTGTALHQLMTKLGDIGTAIPGLVERAQLGGMNALGMRQADGDIYRSKLPVAPGLTALADAGTFATGGLQSSLFPAAGAYREAARYAAREAPRAVGGVLADEYGGIRAFHGSPHSFDRFDLSKIGTGEGAQAYGHGLYFAENEKVARGYREALAGGSYKQLNPWDVTKENTPLASYTRQSLADYGNDPTATLAVLRAAGDERSLAAADLISKQLSKVREVTPGHMYEVDINADPKSFLDWDKPLGKQTEYLQEALAIPKGRMPTGSQVTELIRLGRERGVPYTELPEYKALEEQWKSATASAKFGYNIDPGAPASDFYERLIQNMGSPEAASKALRLADVPGIRYLDQGSRGAGEGSSNYAVFDDSLIQILRKYGLLPPLAGGGLLATQQEQQ